jgi:hypothetical protein
MQIGTPGPTMLQSQWTPAIVCLAGLTLGWAVDSSLLRTPLLAPVLFVPGYYLLGAVLGPGVKLDQVMRIALSVMLSLVLLIGQALLLSTLNVTLTRGSLGLTTAVCVGLLVLVTFLREGQMARSGSDPGQRPYRLRPAPVAGLAGALAALAVAAVVAGHLLPGPESPPYATFSLTGFWPYTQGTIPVQQGQHLDIPVELRASPQSPTAAYQITARLDDQPVSQPMEKTVPPGESVRDTVTVVAPSDGNVHRLVLESRTGNGWHGDIILYLQSLKG